MLVEDPHPPEHLILSAVEAQWFLDELLPVHTDHPDHPQRSRWLTASSEWDVRRIVLVLPRDQDASGTLLRLAAYFTPPPGAVEVLVHLDRGRFSLDPALLARSHRRRLDTAVTRTMEAARLVGLPLTAAHIREFTARAARVAGLREKRAVLRAGMLAVEWDDTHPRTPRPPVAAEGREVTS